MKPNQKCIIFGVGTFLIVATAVALLVYFLGGSSSSSTANVDTVATVGDTSLAETDSRKQNTDTNQSSVTTVNIEQSFANLNDKIEGELKDQSGAISTGAVPWQEYYA